ncbi:MAG: hypothetical protein PHY81_03295 [Candidatus Bipolaricaulis anaerobius]|jgi:hypothetical protein|uniref:Uncharacterized protein n=1 Tax=Candidatus Bipolaricaulis anaerobius TaxID=2026885 RepID=A0A2X3K5A4_9BACT|nr:hypothetical protein [Candidatus Bipolaricaulis anaerobius]MDD3747787.1 hypothetical protein [Candidatus Bipolaricaulis anaerobius]MDD5764104.1 hypothetical protein [Candidatus Bipolaricaulis anaerobius]SQD92457.1 conserved exported protein of unknown function [Candidatus Bipolaricaulis anaerobius]
MKGDRRFGATIVALLLGSTFALVGSAQTDEPGVGQPPVNLFGGGTFPGGYLKYTYTISRQGGIQPSTTTTEITLLPDGTYSVVSTSTETVSLEMVNIGFFGIPLPRLGIHVPEDASGTLDLSPLSTIASAAIEPGKNYLLPDGGRFQAGELGTIAGVQVIHGTYTHADYMNVEIDLAFAVDLAIRGLLPFPAKMVFRYSAASTDEHPFRMFSSVELSEFVYTP